MPEEFKDLPLEDLRLDARNPRLPRELPAEDRSQPELLRQFARNYNLLELARSIADKGFQPRHAEALLVVEEPKGSGEFVVIEGNRRFATLMLLTDAEARRSLRLSPEWEELAAEVVARGFDLDPAPAIVYEDRKDLAEYLGFRHITGPTPWRPEAKARFIATLLEDIGSITEVARRIGSNARTVRRYAEAHAVYEQAIELGIQVDAVEAAFGVFYNALDFPGVRSYLGLLATTQITGQPRDPVPAENLEKLRELIVLLYGDRERGLESVLRESRELRDLSTVLLDGPATTVLLETRDLQHAYRVAGGGRADLLALLRDSFTRLREANGQAYEFKSDDEVVAVVQRIVELVRDMAERYEVTNQE